MTKIVLSDKIGTIKLINTMPEHNIYAYDDGENYISTLDFHIAWSARRSTGNDTGKSYGRDAKLLLYMIENGHSSPFEQVQINFLVKAPLFVARQWMRHRTFSYNEQSLRYLNVYDSAEFYIPDVWRLQDEVNKQGSAGEHEESEEFSKRLNDYCNLGMEHYRSLIQQGVAKEMARIFLTPNIYTEFVVSGNLWNWMQFVKKRKHQDAQWEIRCYAEAISEYLYDIAPISFGAFNAYSLSP